MRALPLLLWALVGCQDDLLASEPLPALDEAAFRCTVQPVLTKTCGMLACHGSPDRSFVLYGRNRLRLDDREPERNAPLTADERAINLAAALALVDLDDPASSPLVQKPLALDVGGRWHGGAETFGGGDVFADLDDRDLGVVLEWLAGAEEDPGCEEPGSAL